MKRFRLLHPILASAALLALACSDAAHLTAPIQSAAPAFAIGDAARGFKQGFYWLPPMVGNPVTSGTFDGGLSPVVEICAVDGDACNPALDLVETFTTEGSGSTTIRVGPDDGHYIVNWHMGDYDLTGSTHYRISVFAGPDVLLGFADVEPVATGGEIRNVDTGEYIGLVDGRTLPIKFRIETGVVAGVSIDPDQATIAPGETQQFTATVTDLHGNTLAAAVAWTSENESVASVDGGGAATGVGPGSTTITATVDHESASATLLVESGGGWAQISAGDNHTCGVTTAGAAFCWGSGSGGKLGNGGTDDQHLPVAVAGNHQFASISASAAHTCGVTTAGEAFCWGHGLEGRLGNGGTDNRLSPVAVAGNHQFASISPGLLHTCGVTTAGEGLCWGYNANGAVGNGGTNNQLSPAAVAGNHQFASISAGAGFSCGVTTAGVGFCWGDEFGGKLGNGSLNVGQQTSPVPVAGSHQFAAISAGRQHACGVTTDDEAFCWGEGSRGRLGDGVVGLNNRATPVAVLGNHRFAAIDAGGLHSCGVTPANEAFCWGEGALGALGDGGTDQEGAPVLVAGTYQFASISAGFVHSCDVTTNGEAYCWGRGTSGELGNGQTANQFVPVRVSDPF